MESTVHQNCMENIAEGLLPVSCHPHVTETPASSSPVLSEYLEPEVRSESRLREVVTNHLCVSHHPRSMRSAWPA